MKIKDLKIGTQLLIGFGTMFLFVIILGVISYRQSRQIHLQTDMIYNHPFKVKSAIGDLNADILNIRVGMRDIMLSTKDKENERQVSIQLMEVSAADAHQQFDIIKSQYLGSKKDVENAEKAYIRWYSATSENLKMLQAGELARVKSDILEKGSVGVLREEMFTALHKIETFAENKNQALFESSSKLTDDLNRQLIFIIIGVLLIMLIIDFVIIRNIRNPIDELTLATKNFTEGDLNARSQIDSKNEYGELSSAFNRMVRDIQNTTEQRVKTAEIAELMLTQTEPTNFFTAVLPAIAQHTDSQMAAVYLLSDDKTHFEHFHSFGMDNSARKSFEVNSLEGEFGSVLSTGKIQTINKIPKDTRFLFHTVSGKLVPREIITIPVFLGNEIVAIISLASIRSYTPNAELLIHNIHDTLSARISGVLAYQKMQNLLKKLEFQNTELEMQKVEMEAQSVELKDQNRELEMQKNQLNEANKLKTNFLSNMSHELRTPLNSVIALSGVLSRRLANKIPADEFSYLEVIERNGKHLLSLINDILDISRIEAGREEIEISKFSVAKMTAELVEMIDPQARQKHITLNLKPFDNNVYISSDLIKCRHILQNLIANAVKFTEKGKVEIQIQQKNENIEISVSDTGIGISHKHIDHIFDEFRQADASTSRRYGGTGLGLSIARKYAQLLGGTIYVKSELDKGSTFTLVLPMHFSEDVIVEEINTNNSLFVSNNAQFHQKQGVKTILLVDDSEPAIIQMEDFLIGNGYKVLVAHTGNEALSLISTVIPDAIILDLMMPEIDGFDVLAAVRNADQTAHIPVLILTAKHITKEDLKFLKRNNIHQLIQKGDVNQVELLKSVNSLFFVPELEVSKPILPIQNINGKPTVLIVEDNVDNMTTVKAIIGDKFKLFEAFNGNQGLSIATEQKPNLILMDIALPDIDGIEVLNTIRQNGELAHIPIIAITASAMITDRETILAHGFDAYIPKPIDESIFFKTIDYVLYGK